MGARVEELDAMLLEDLSGISRRKASLAIALPVSQVKPILALKEEVEMDDFRPE